MREVKSTEGRVVVPSRSPENARPKAGGHVSTLRKSEWVAVSELLPNADHWMHARLRLALSAVCARTPGIGGCDCELELGRSSSQSP